MRDAAKDLKPGAWLAMFCAVMLMSPLLVISKFIGRFQHKEKHNATQKTV